MYVSGTGWHDGRKGSDHCIVFGTLIPTNEFFVWDQLKLPHAINTTQMIVDAIAEKSGNLKYLFNLIDPLANKIQSNVNITVVEDINRQFLALKRRGLGMGGVWETWDTKSVLGREEMKKRLNNSLKVGQPYNNVEEVDGVVKYLPTIWLDKERCPDIRKSVGKWSTNKNGEPEQKYSHYCTSLEGGFKDIRFKARMNTEEFERHNPYAKYFHMKGRRG